MYLMTCKPSRYAGLFLTPKSDNMKKILLILLSCCFIVPCTLADVPQKNKKADTTEVAGEDGDLQAEQKEAEKWVKNHIGKCKKLLSELKKIKKPNACKRAEGRIKKRVKPKLCGI